MSAQNGSGRTASQPEMGFPLEMSAERDLPPARCRFRFLVCSSARTGSNMLCRALTASGRAGLPLEYMHPLAVAAWEDRFGMKVSSAEVYLAALAPLRTTPNGIFGAKIHYHQLERFFATREERISFIRGFDRVIRVTRRNKVAQAISSVRAAQTGIWFSNDADHASATRAVPVRYDAAAIAANLDFVLREDEAWDELLAAAEIPHLCTRYEDMAAGFGAVMSSVFDHLGIEPDAAPARPPTPRMGDGLNADWERRFRAETAAQPSTGSG